MTNHPNRNVPSEIDFSEDVIDVRDVIARFEYLKNRRGERAKEERGVLQLFLESVAGEGSDEEWHGSWYPLLFIRDSHFEDYARDLAEDVAGEALREARWPMTCIDWERAVMELQQDYTTVDVEGHTYWYR